MYNHVLHLFMGIFIDPPYLGYNCGEQETSVLHIFTFQEPSGTQSKRGFFWSHHFSWSNKMR
jgi:hypothetical protein